MALETGSYLSDLVPANPPGTDVVSQGSGHLRLLKSILQTSFPNVNAAVNAIHTGTSAPTSTSSGLIWFDEQNNLIKIRNEADSGWITLLASEGSRLLKTTHDIETTTSSLRSDEYVDTGWSITHTCVSASSNLYIHVDGMNDVYSAWDGGSDHQYTYIKLANTSGALITGTTDNILVGDIKDLVPSGLSSCEWGFGFSHTWKVIPANRPDTPGAVGANTFDIWSKQPMASAGGTTFVSGNMMVWEVEE
ncbi:MAG: hypothetical protein ACPHAN_11345 [Pseudomonadales bacterium]